MNDAERVALEDLQKRVEELTERNEWLGLAMESGQLATFRCDLQTGALTRQVGLGRILRQSAGQSAGGQSSGDDSPDGSVPTLSAYFSHVHPDDRDEIRDAVMRVRSGDASDFRVEHRVVVADGTRWFEARGELPRTGNSGSQRLCGVVMDITTRKRAELELEESRDRLQSVVSTVPHFVLQIDRDGVIQFCNRTYAETTIEQILGTSLFDRVAFECRAALRQSVALAFETGEPQQLEVVAKGPDGGRAYFLNHIGPRVRGGVVHSCTISAFECTEQHLAEQALEISEERLQLATESAGLGVWDFDVTSNRLYWDARMCELYDCGLPAGFVPADTWRLRVFPDDHDRIQRLIQELSPDTDFFEAECRIRIRDGSVRHLRTSGQVVRDDQGRIIRQIGFNWDVTETRQLQEQLLQVQKLDSIGSLAGGVAHDFNNLLSAVLGYSEVAMEMLPQGSEEHHIVEYIRNAARRGATLTSQLLAFARKQVFQPRVVCIAQLIRKTEQLLRRVIGEHIVLEANLEPGSLLSRVDPGQIEQVLVNLAVNARDALPDGGRLILDARSVRLPEDSATGELTQGDYVQVTVSDDGIGMAEEVRQRVFEPFFTTKPFGRGTGLGLATAFGIVRQSGGTISARSRPGQGSTFTVLLPRADTPAEPATREEKVELYGGSETILLVEDEAVVREVGEVLLSRLGYRMLLAEDAQEALDIFEREGQAVSLLLTDVVMPGRSGPELYDVLRMTNPDLKILFLSGYTKEQTAISAEHRRNNFVHKPFNQRELAEKIRVVLDEG